MLQQHELSDADEARAMVRYWAQQGFTSFKAYEHITRRQLTAAVDEAHKQELKITGHLCSITYREAANLGIDQLEHGFFALTDFVVGKKPDQCPSIIERMEQLAGLTPEDKGVQELFSHLIANEVVITSTLELLARVAYMAPALPQDEESLLDQDSRTSYQLAMQNESIDLIKKVVEVDRALEASFWRAGGKLVVGTDPTMTGVIPGYGSLRSIEMLVEAGIPPLEVIKIATENGAQAMGVAQDRGTIAEGKRADLIVIKGNPVENIKAIHNIETVFKEGVGYDPVALRKSVMGSIGAPG